MRKNLIIVLAVALANFGYWSFRSSPDLATPEGDLATNGVSQTQTKPPSPPNAVAAQTNPQPKSGCVARNACLGLGSLLSLQKPIAPRTRPSTRTHIKDHWDESRACLVGQKNCTELTTVTPRLCDAGDACDVEGGLLKIASSATYGYGR